MRQDFVDECARVMMACTAPERGTVRMRLENCEFIFTKDLFASSF